MIKYTKLITFNTVYGGNMNIKKGLSIFISAVMVFSPITSVRAYDADDDKAVIESPAVSDNDISEEKKFFYATDLLSELAKYEDLVLIYNAMLDNIKEYYTDALHMSEQDAVKYAKMTASTLILHKIFYR